jgi:HTH-type transcriptional repressor of NAD biosynthesis genes
MSTRHGLVMGKFYPPHAGHRLLVHAAAAACERVTVLVLAHPAESIPLEDRVAWLRKIHRDAPQVVVHGAMDAHPIDYDDSAVWDLHIDLIRAKLAEVTPVPVSAVFCSEPYGPELARRLGARCVDVDPTRVLRPMSGTAVRRDLVRSWEYLDEPVRAGLAARVVVIGAESTGTTTVSRGITDALRARGGNHGLTQWVPEHGRDFTVDKLAVARARAVLEGGRSPALDELVWEEREFVEIARRQNELEDLAALRGGPVLVCDTDAFATGIWCERYLGTASPDVDAIARRHPLYLLTHHDGVPFEQDGIRDGESIREWMTGRFEEALAASGRRTVVLRGSIDERVATGLAAIDELIGSRLRFSAPVTPATGTVSVRSS